MLSTANKTQMSTDTSPTTYFSLPLELRYEITRFVVEDDLKVSGKKWVKYMSHGKIVKEFVDVRGLTTKRLVSIDPSVCSEAIRVVKPHQERHIGTLKVVQSALADYEGNSTLQAKRAANCKIATVLGCPQNSDWIQAGQAIVDDYKSLRGLMKLLEVIADEDSYDIEDD